MAITVAFWNINMGTGSNQRRLRTFEDWCNDIQPDLLFLEEASFTLRRDHLERITGLDQVGRVGTLDVNDNPTTKDLVSLGDNGDFNSRPLRFPSLEQRRLLLKVTEAVSTIQGLAVWCIHANASRTGGRTAVNAVLDQLGKPSGAGTVVGGDFNCPIGQAGASAIHPLNYAGAPLAFTQWNKVDGMTSVNRYGNNAMLYRKIVPHDVIDYVIHGPNRTVVAQNNCTNQQRWTDILREFDHCPVVYQITG